MSRRYLIGLLLIVSCVLHTGPAPQPLAPSECRTSAQVTGTWTSAGMSQLGPARSKYIFGCDCILEVRSSLLWTRLGGRFRYSVAGETIVVEQKRPAEVHFTRDGDSLLLVWPGGDRESLKLVTPDECPHASPKAS